LLDGNERANFHFREAFASLDDDLDIFALFAGGCEERQIAEFSEHAAEFRLENDDDADGQEGGKGTQNPSQHDEVQDARDE